MPSGMHVVVGCNGPVGVATMFELRSRGLPVRGASRSGRSEAPDRTEIVQADARDPEAMQRLCADATVVYGTVGLPYPEWTSEWPKIVRGLLTGARGKRLVFADNLYAYGPQTRPLTEDMPLTEVGQKPALRARLDREMLLSHTSGACRVALVRASDFYGPRVRASLLGEQVLEPVVSGGAARLLPGVDEPHSFTYIDDFARALVDLAVAPDDAYGRSWHVPNAPAKTVREIVAMLYALAGREPKVTVMPGFMLSVLGWFSPLMREIGEMRQNLEKPYLVDSSAFVARFGWEAMPLSAGLERTIEWYRRAEATVRDAT
jgi:nucleoside-diphosphate-sugar epimerase